MDVRRFQDLARFGGTARGGAARRAQLRLFKAVFCCPRCNICSLGVGSRLSYLRKDWKTRSYPSESTHGGAGRRQRSTRHYLFGFRGT